VPVSPDSFLSSVCDADAFDIEYLSDRVECALDCARQRMLVHVPRAQRCTTGSGLITRLVDVAGDLPCTHVVVYVHKTHASFADWLRRFLYQGFTVHQAGKRWADAGAGPDVVACVFDLADASSGSDTGGSAVTGDETDAGDDSDSESDLSDEE